MLETIHSQSQSRHDGNPRKSPGSRTGRTGFHEALGGKDEDHSMRRIIQVFLLFSCVAFGQLPVAIPGPSTLKAVGTGASITGTSCHQGDLGLATDTPALY